MNSKTAKDHSSDLISTLLESIPQKERELTKRKMLLAAKIYDGIQTKGWSKKDFAAKVGCHASEVTKWISGTHNFTIDTLWAIQDVLNIKLIDLEKESPEVIQSIRAFAVAHFHEPLRYGITPYPTAVFEAGSIDFESHVLGLSCATMATLATTAKKLSRNQTGSELIHG